MGEPLRLPTSQGCLRPVTAREQEAGRAFLGTLARRLAQHGWRAGGWTHADGRESLPALVAAGRKQVDARSRPDGYRPARAALGAAAGPGPWTKVGEAVPCWAGARISIWEATEGRTQEDVRQLIARAIQLLEE